MRARSVFNFDDWVKDNKLDAIQPLLLKHGMNTININDVYGNEFKSLMCDKELLSKKQHMIPVILDALRRVNECYKHTKFIVFSEEEYSVINNIKLNEKTLNDLEIDIYALQQQLQSLVEPQQAKLKQIEDIRKTTIDQFDVIKQSFNAEINLRQEIILTELDEMESALTTEEEVKMLQNSTRLLQNERNNLREVLAICHDKFRLMGNDERKQRKQQIVKIGNEMQTKFSKIKTSITNSFEKVYQLKKSYEFEVEMNFMDHSKIGKTIKNIGSFAEIIKTYPENIRPLHRYHLCVFGFIRRVQNFYSNLELPMDIQCVICDYWWRNSLIYEYDFDQNGICYLLGTNYGTEEWTNPAERGWTKLKSYPQWSDHCSINAVVGRTSKKYSRTERNVSNAWISVTFVALQIQPSAYTLRHYDNVNSCALRSWNFEGSNDGIKWTVLKKHLNDEALKKKGQSHTWQIKKCGYYQSFRIYMTGVNSNNQDTLYLCCSGLEIYGQLKLKE
eukprot:46178_1